MFLTRRRECCFLIKIDVTPFGLLTSLGDFGPRHVPVLALTSSLVFQLRGMSPPEPEFELFNRLSSSKTLAAKEKVLSFYAGRGSSLRWDPSVRSGLLGLLVNILASRATWNDPNTVGDSVFQLISADAKAVGSIWLLHVPNTLCTC